MKKSINDGAVRPDESRTEPGCRPTDPRVVESDRRLLTAAQTAEVLELPIEKVEWLNATGQLVAIKIAGEIRYALRDIDRLIDFYRKVQGNKMQEVY